MEEDFEISDLTERDLFFPLYYGPRGVKWLHFDDVIDDNNSLMFTCSYCRKTTSSSDEGNFRGELAHELKCRNKLMNMLGL